jgi:hypothetical protein
MPTMNALAASPMHGLPDCTLHYAELQFDASDGHSPMLQPSLNAQQMDVNSLGSAMTHQAMSQSMGQHMSQQQSMQINSNMSSPYHLTKMNQQEDAHKVNRVHVLCSSGSEHQTAGPNPDSSKFESTV